MTIVWSPEAAEDLASLRDYIGNHNPAAARRIASLIVEAVERGIAAHPELGRAGRVPGTRELVIPNTPVIIPYRVRERTLEILGIHHHARRPTVSRASASPYGAAEAPCFLNTTSIAA